ncbi:MAG TPA: hypothetical protein P5541_06360 [Thermovirgaceae bacterium]|jgi:hypothetical protein|nr:hypothetical protein [Thermovirgaceae bacterium]
MSFTDQLFAMPGFFGGMASALDMGNTLTIFNESCTPEEADAMAIRSDWKIVGQDLRSAMQVVDDETR